MKVTKAEQTRARILQATMRVLATQGYAATTARSIATEGGFAPGVIYYHFADLPELFAATARYISDERMLRYRTEVSEVTRAVELLRRLKALYAEDVESGSIAAVQELIAAAKTSERLVEEVRASTAAWQDLAAETIGRFLEGIPLAHLIPVREAAAAAVAGYLGTEMLTHLDANTRNPDALFDAAMPAARFVDLVRKVPRRRRRTPIRKEAEQ